MLSFHESFSKNNKKTTNNITYQVNLKVEDGDVVGSIIKNIEKNDRNH